MYTINSHAITITENGGGGGRAIMIRIRKSRRLVRPGVRWAVRETGV